MTCERYQSMEDDKEIMDEWIKGDSENRKLCPKCACGIEKIEGCNHMTCSECRCHFCWICLKIYDDAQETYKHLMREHGNIY